MAAFLFFGLVGLTLLSIDLLTAPNFPGLTAIVRGLSAIVGCRCGDVVHEIDSLPGAPLSFSAIARLACLPVLFATVFRSRRRDRILARRPFATLTAHRSRR